MCGRVPHIIFASTYNSCSTCSGLCTASCVGSTIANSSLTCASNYCASGCSGVCDNKTCTSRCSIVYRVVKVLIFVRICVMYNVVLDVDHLLLIMSKDVCLLPVRLQAENKN